ncbi:MAG: hypothetical protein ONB16_12420 [candidate division KSB1 bacterium]|nr:hypothetical protein [candidate division KSB1 bacterium]
MPSGNTDSGYPVHWQEDSGEWIKIKDFQIRQLVGTLPGYIVKKGEKFDYLLKVNFSPIMGAIGGGAGIKIGIYAMDLSKGSVQPAYTKELDRDLKPPRDTATDKQWNRANDPDFEFTASVTGTFLITTVVTCPDTGISSFSTGPLLQVFP